ncbi:MAG: hypothetical protein PHV30_00065 [Candidatus Margulisbacteria bacterium]|nr:hypothetical protein [Candidatus Margulisiibacteriota bacterium]
MVFKLLTDRKKTREIASFYENKKKILYHQDVFLNTYLKKFSISKYLLFVRKDNAFIVATYKGYLNNEVENLSFSVDSMIVDFLQGHHLMADIEVVNEYYRDAVFLPKSFNSVIKDEKQIWEKLGINYFFPVFNDNNEMIAFMLCKGQFINAKPDDLVNFLKIVYDWSKSYHNLYVDNETRQELTKYQSFMDYTYKLTQCNDIEAVSEEILIYFSNLFKSTKSIMFVLNKGFFIPVKHLHIDMIKSYPRTVIEKVKKQQFLEIREIKDLFFEEFGRGPVRLLFINSKCFLALKHVFTSHLSEQFLNAVISLTNKMLTCQQES